MAFDPDTGSPTAQGFTQLEPPVNIPARSPSDTLYQMETFPSNKDREHCQFTGEKIGSHKDSGVTKDSGEQFAEDHGSHENGNLQEKIGN